VDMMSRRFSPTVITYGILMNCCCAQGDFSNAQKVFDEMLERGIEPNVVIYTILIGVCFATRVKWEKRRACLDE